MDFVKFSLAGLDDFLVYFALSSVYVALFLAVYVRATPYREFELIRQGNIAAAVSLSGALIGFVLPLASTVIHSVNLLDMSIWAAIALVVQILVFFVVRALMPTLVQHIPEGKAASGVFLGSASLAAGILNAACLTY